MYQYSRLCTTTHTLPPTLPGMVLSYPRGTYPLFGIQRTRFEKIRSDASNLNIRNVCWHAANSAALIRDRSTWYDAVRPGLLLYGVVPPPFETPLGMELRAVMSLRTRVVAVKGMRCGETSGYGARFVANRPMRVGISGRKNRTLC